MLELTSVDICCIDLSENSGTINNMEEKERTPEKLMTLQEVADYLQIKERTIYQWAQLGKIPGFKLGNIWRFKREDIDTWIEEQKQNTPRKKKETP